MATYTNQLLVLNGAKIQKISASDDLVIGGGFSAASFTGDGSALTSLNASNLSSGTVADARLSSNVALYDAAAPNFTNTVTAAGFSGDGSALTSLNASNVSSGTLADARLSSNVPLKDAVGNVFTGSITAASFSGSGVGLTNIPAEHVTGAGLLPDSVLSSNVALYNAAAPTFTNTVSAAGFSGDGSALTSLNASNLSSGTVADARLSSNVALKNAATQTFSGNLNVGGNLTVTGNIVSAGEVNLVVKDSFIDLDAGNTVFGVLKAGGLAVNIECQSATPFTATDFVAGSVGVVNPEVTVAEDASGLSTGDLIQISGTTDGTNDGQYVVLATSGTGPTTITVKGIGVVAVDAQTPFAHNQFTAATGETAALVKIRVSAFSASNDILADNTSTAIPVGTFCYASGSDESAFINNWTSIDPANATLQSAYDKGASIVMTNGRPFYVSYDSGAVAAIQMEASAASFIRAKEGASLELVADGGGPISVIGLNGGDANVSATGGGKVKLSSENVYVNGFMSNDGVNAGTLPQYTLVAYDSTGDLVAADADTSDVVPVGFVNDDNTIFSTMGMRSRCFGATGTSWLPGATLYLSNDAGKVTDVVPTSGRIYVVGVATDAFTEGVDTYAFVRFAPMYVADL